MEPDLMKNIVIGVLEDIKAQDISVLDVRELTSFASYMIIATATSNRQTRALAHHIREKLSALGVRTLGVEGEQEGEWILVDLGEIIVHLMLQVTRLHYNLEQLWSTADNHHKVLSTPAAP